MKIIFFGTSEFGKIILEKLVQSGYKPILVVTTPDKPSGRKQEITPSPVRALAVRHGIPVNRTGSDPVRLSRVDLIIVAAYGKLIPRKILDISKYGALNVHPSLLPRWRGPSPIQHTILNGDKETGVTIMLMDEEIDHGPVIVQHKFNMLRSDPPQLRGVRPQLFNAGELTLKLASLSAELLIKTIPQWIAGEIQPKEQDHKKATYTKILTKEDGHIDWTKSAEEIERQIRAFTPWPGTFTFWQDKRIKILKGHVLNSRIEDTAFSVQVQGEALTCNGKQLGVQTGNGIFAIDIIQLEGKSAMNSKQFLNGYSDIIGAELKAPRL